LAEMFLFYLKIIFVAFFKEPKIQSENINYLLSILFVKVIIFLNDLLISFFLQNLLVLV
jgi:hypothetical protein